MNQEVCTKGIGRPKKQEREDQFDGFTQASIHGEYFRVPTIWINVCAVIDNLAELKVVQYIMRHTWGYREYEKEQRITLDEFINGRKFRRGELAGQRMDLGTRLSKEAVINGLERAVKHGFVVYSVDASDKARVKKYYALKLAKDEQGDEYNNFEGEQQGEVYDNFEYRQGDEYDDFEYGQREVYDNSEYEQEEAYDNSTYGQEGLSFNHTTENDPDVIVNDPAVVENYSESNYQQPRTKERNLKQTYKNKETRKASPSIISHEDIRHFPPPQQRKGNSHAAPAFLREVMESFSRDLGDHEHIGSNISQANNLYVSSTLDPDAFMKLLYEGKSLAQKASIKKVNSRGWPNRMPYFFKCLRNMVNSIIAKSGLTEEQQLVQTAMQL